MACREPTAISAHPPHPPSLNFALSSLLHPVLQVLCPGGLCERRALACSRRASFPPFYSVRLSSPVSIRPCPTPCETPPTPCQGRADSKPSHLTLDTPPASLPVIASTPLRPTWGEVGFHPLLGLTTPSVLLTAGHKYPTWLDPTCFLLPILASYFYLPPSCSFSAALFPVRNIVRCLSLPSPLEPLPPSP